MKFWASWEDKSETAIFGSVSTGVAESLQAPVLPTLYTQSWPEPAFVTITMVVIKHLLVILAWLQAEKRQWTRRIFVSMPVSYCVRVRVRVCVWNIWKDVKLLTCLLGFLRTLFLVLVIKLSQQGGNLMFAADCPTKRAAFMTDMTLGRWSHVPAISILSSMATG